jgi:erythromycin esterase-like protein
VNALDDWLRGAVVLPQALDPGDAEVILLGELNHFVHEKSDFRLAFVNHFAGLGYDVCAEELGWSDGARIDAFLRSRDERVFDHISLFGHRGDARTDRDDRLGGIFRAAIEAYPTELMRAEQTRFYRGVNPRAYYGFDVAAGHDGGYADIDAETAAASDATVDAWRRGLARVAGESIDEEVARLTALSRAVPASLGDPVRAALEALIDGLRYTALLRDAQTYEATRPAMAFRENAMKRRLADIRALSPGRMILMGHAMHLAKDDGRIDAPAGVGPGGGRVSSLGHHVAQELSLKTFSVWMIYGAGEDSQPLPDLPRSARYPPDTLNAKLAARFSEPTLISTVDAPDEPALIGHMYNSVFRTHLRDQVDALYFVPRVTPMRLEA